MDIGNISLDNGGGFVTRIHVLAKPVLGGEETEFKNAQDIPLGASHTVDLGALGVPDGYAVKLKACVVWGTDNTAHQSFVYRKDVSKTARYSITGVTLNNKLGLIEVSK